MPSQPHKPIPTELRAVRYDTYVCPECDRIMSRDAFADGPSAVYCANPACLLFNRRYVSPQRVEKLTLISHAKGGP